MCGVRAGKRVCSGERSSRMNWRTLRFIVDTLAPKKSCEVPL